MKQGSIFRQGDVMLIPCNVKPNGEIKQYTQLTVQLGEASGHHHTLYSKDYSGVIGNDSLLETVPENNCIEEFIQDNKRFIRLDSDWLLKHQEHECLNIPAGTYEIRIEQEYDPFEESRKKVID